MPRSSNFASAILRQGRRLIAIGLCIRCAALRRRFFQYSGGLQQDLAWSALRRMSLSTNLGSVQSFSSSAARNLPLCYSWPRQTLAEFGYGIRNRGCSQRRRKSRWLKRAAAAKSQVFKIFRKSHTRYQLLVTRNIAPSEKFIFLFSRNCFAISFFKNFRMSAS